MSIVIVDTGCANLSSVRWAVRRLGYDPITTFNINTILNAKKLLIPGVGTASSVMKHMYQNNLVDVIRKYKKPILGICLGFQLLCACSTESKKKFVKTLNIINEPVVLLKTRGLSLPHTGWNNVFPVRDHVLFKGISKKSRFYFIHSYGVAVNQYTIATSFYGQKFTSVIQKNNFFGVQFHPEKSGLAGSILLKNFLGI